MTTIEARGEAFDIGRVVTRTFGSIGRNAATFFLLALGLVGLPQVVLGYLQVQLNPGAAGLAATRTPGEMITYGLLVIVIALATIVLSALLQAAVIRGVVEDLNGRRVRIAECLSAGMSVALPVIAISIMVGLGIFAGLILLIVPGIILAIRWIVAIPTRVMEQPGVFAAMGRSAELTKGSRWAIFAVVLVFAILVWVLTAVVLGSAAALSIAAPTSAATFVGVPYLVLSGILNAVTSTVSSAGVAAIYCELRAIKEGASPSSLAAVFD
jgi:hypothetical protein